MKSWLYIERILTIDVFEGENDRNWWSRRDFGTSPVVSVKLLTRRLFRRLARRGSLWVFHNNNYTNLLACSACALNPNMHCRRAKF